MWWLPQACCSSLGNVAVMAQNVATGITWCDWQVDWGCCFRSGCSVILSFLYSFIHSFIHSFIFIQGVANARCRTTMNSLNLKHGSTMRDETVYLQQFCMTGCSSKIPKCYTHTHTHALCLGLLEEDGCRSCRRLFPESPSYREKHMTQIAG